MKKTILLLAPFALLFWSSHAKVFPLRSMESVTRAAVNPIPITAKPAMENKAETTVRGELLKAFQRAYAAFLRSPTFPNDKKNIQNYDVQFTESAENVIVLFVPRRKPDERPLLGGATSLGVAVRFVVSKDNYRVIEMRGFR